MKKLMVAALVAASVCGSIAVACECTSGECDTKKVTVEATVNKGAADNIAQEVTDVLKNNPDVQNVQISVEATNSEFCEDCQTKGCDCNKPRSKS